MDMLIRLFHIPHFPRADRCGEAIIRKPIAPEYDVVAGWIADHFSRGWASEARASMTVRPISLFIATRSDTLLGFCCYDATARGFVGPIGVAKSVRGTGVGAALLRACLADMRAMGYGYAVAGAVGAPEFFRRVAGAVEIADSSPGIYRGMLRG